MSDRVKVIWINHGRNEKEFETLEAAEPFMKDLEKEGALYFWDWIE